jgi:hypothetical protein
MERRHEIAGMTTVDAVSAGNMSAAKTCAK